MAEVYELSDRVSVLRDGTYVGTLDRDELSADALVKMMVGRDLVHLLHQGARSARQPRPGDPRGQGHHRRRPAGASPRSFQLHQGEVLGIAGLVGSGRTELARLIYGADPKAGGERAAGRQPVNITRARGGARRRHRLPDRGPQARSACSSTCPAARTSTSASSTATRAAAASSTWPGRGRALGRGVQGAARARGQPAGHRRQPVRRQPAEGAAVALAGDRPEGADPGRADPRRRHRRQVRDLPDHRRARAERASASSSSPASCPRSSASATACW